MAGKTIREAVLTQAFEELDTLLGRVEGLKKGIDESGEKLARSSESLDGASDRYRLAVTAFTDQAKGELTEYLQRKAAETVSITKDQQVEAMREAAAKALSNQVISRLINTAAELNATSKAILLERRRSAVIGILAFLAGASAGIAGMALFWK